MALHLHPGHLVALLIYDIDSRAPGIRIEQQLADIRVVLGRSSSTAFGEPAWTRRDYSAVQDRCIHRSRTIHILQRAVIVLDLIHEGIGFSIERGCRCRRIERIQ